MPTNLNALIRYKQIDKCLSNPNSSCTLLRLRELCTEAIEEYKGVNRLISERTIREDIRIMRSEILDFNAPIIFTEGEYKYSDPEFTIFNKCFQSRALLFDIFYTLKKERDNINNNDIDEILQKIASILGNPPKETGNVRYKTIKPIEYLNMDTNFLLEAFSINDFEHDMYNPVYNDYLDVVLEKLKAKYKPHFLSPQDDIVVYWRDIVGLL